MPEATPNTPQPGAARGPARLLRGRRPRRPDRRARARPARRARLRPQGDRPQQARGRAAQPSAARSSSTRRPRCPRARSSSSAPTASLPAVHANAAKRQLRTIDATCPLVTKVHVEARKFAEEGYTIVMIGHDGHEEVEGTTGEAPDSIILVETDRGRRPARDRRSRQGRLHHPDDPLGRRDGRRHRPPPRALPEHREPEVRRHLLRDDEPPARRQAARGASATSCS